MYPVLSVLRRAAVSYIYATPAMLVTRGGVSGVRLEKKSSYLLLETGEWSKRSVDFVPIVELLVRSDTSVEAAISLAKKENDIAEAFRAEEALYTLVLGPEEQARDSRGYVRRFRCAVVQGVFRANAGRQLEPQPARNVVKAQFSGAPSKRGVRLD